MRRRPSETRHVLIFGGMGRAVRLPPPEVAPKPPGIITAALVLSLSIAVAALVLFAWIAEEVFEGDAARFDHYVRTLLHSWATPGVTTTMVALSFLGSPLFLGSLFAGLIVLFLVLKWRRAALWFITDMAGAVVLIVALKLLFHRARPVPFFGTVPHSYSFPSGHALGSVCFYGVLAGLMAHRVRGRLLKILLCVSAALLVVGIGFSRIYLGVHYPTDVIAGYLAAAVWVAALVLVDGIRIRRRSGSAQARPAA